MNRYEIEANRFMGNQTDLHILTCCHVKKKQTKKSMTGTLMSLLSDKPCLAAMTEADVFIKCVSLFFFFFCRCSQSGPECKHCLFVQSLFILR